MVALEIAPLQKIAVMIAGTASPRCSMPEDDPDRGVIIFRERLDFHNFESAIEERRPNVILIDGISTQSRSDILQFLRGLRRSFPELRCILVIDQSEMGFLVSAFQCGVRGLLLSQQLSTASLAKCVRCVHDGQVWISNEVLTSVLDAFSRAAPLRTVPASGSLSPREQQVLSLVVRGLSNREIAEVLSVTENTVKKYVYEVFNKTGTSSRVELVLQALHSESVA